MLIALCVFGYASFQLTDIYLGYKEGKDVYKDIVDQFMIPVIDDSNEPETDKDGFTISNSTDGEEFVFDFDGLKKFNKDSVGWIRLDDGEYISYPILQTTDNDKYLRHLINKKYNVAGSIFIDYRCEGGLDARNPIIYGHDMNNLTMFGSLKYFYNNKKYYKEHPYFDIWVGKTHYRYYIFSIYHTDLNNTDTYQYTYADDEDFLEYVKKRQELSIVQIDVGEIKAEDHIATLSTCVGNKENLRLVMHLVRREVVEDNVEENTESSKEK